MRLEYLVIGEPWEITIVAHIKPLAVLPVVAYAILSGCVFSPAEIETVAIMTSSLQTIIATTAPSGTAESVTTTEVFTPVVKATQAEQQTDERSVPTTVATTPVSATVEPTIRPTSVEPDLILAHSSADAVASYWTLVNNNDYKSAWMMLSEGFQQRKHKNDYSHYHNTYQDMNICHIKMIYIKTIEEHERLALVSAHMSYLNGITCDNERDFVFDFKLNRENKAAAWKIDMVVPVANRDILLDATDKCEDNMAVVVPSSLNVRTGPGAGRPGETLYPIQSYLQKNECVTAAATNASHTWVRVSNAPRADAEGGWVAASFLKFDNDHLGTSLLPVFDEPTPHPTTPALSSGVVQPIGIEHLGDAEYVCYDIQGISSSELALEMDILGPYDSDGNKTWAVASLQFVVSGGTCYSDGTVDLSDVSVSLNSTITMPCWYPPSGTDMNEISSFDNLMKLIAIHEIRHVEIAWKWASVLERQLRNANTCDQAALNTIHNQVWAAEEAAQDEFHASPEGQIIPYP